MKKQNYTCFEDEVSSAVRNSEIFANGKSTISQLVASLLCALQAKDEYSLMHSLRVARYSAMLASEMNLNSEAIAKAYLSGLLHDIGKISIPDAVLFKQGRLDSTEFCIIQSHAEMSERICKPIDVLSDILPAIRGHHERLDGKGYPDNLAGEDIPLLARIIAVADSFDAMTSNRPYRKHMNLKKVWSIMESGAGTQWDASIVDVLRQNYDRNRFRCNLGHESDWGLENFCHSALEDGTSFAI